MLRPLHDRVLFLQLSKGSAEDEGGIARHAEVLGGGDEGGVGFSTAGGATVQGFAGGHVEQEDELLGVKPATVREERVAQERLVEDLPDSRFLQLA